MGMVYVEIQDEHGKRVELESLTKNGLFIAKESLNQMIRACDELIDQYDE